MKPKILFLEDDLKLRQSLVSEFTDRGYEALEAGSIDELESLERQNITFGYAVIDLRLGGDNGLKALKRILDRDPSCRAVVLTGYGAIATTVEAIKLGAVNYLTKPVSIDVLEAALREELKAGSEPAPRFTSLSKQEHEYIEFVLAQNEGNITRAAKALGLHRQSLQRKLKKNP